jgi:hypothetical protein
MRTSLASVAPTEVDPMTQAIDNAAITLLRLANGYQISQAIHVAAELKVADIIGDDRYPSRICATCRRPSR